MLDLKKEVQHGIVTVKQEPGERYSQVMQSEIPACIGLGDCLNEKPPSEDVLTSDLDSRTIKMSPGKKMLLQAMFKDIPKNNRLKKKKDGEKSAEESAGHSDGRQLSGEVSKAEDQSAGSVGRRWSHDSELSQGQQSQHSQVSSIAVGESAVSTGEPEPLTDRDSKKDRITENKSQSDSSSYKEYYLKNLHVSKNSAKPEKKKRGRKNNSEKTAEKGPSRKSSITSETNSCVSISSSCSGTATPVVAAGEQPVKRKRGRPRKYPPKEIVEQVNLCSPQLFGSPATATTTTTPGSSVPPTTNSTKDSKPAKQTRKHKKTKEDTTGMQTESTSIDDVTSPVQKAKATKKSSKKEKRKRSQSGSQDRSESGKQEKRGWQGYFSDEDSNDSDPADDRNDRLSSSYKIGRKASQDVEVTCR